MRILLPLLSCLVVVSPLAHRLRAADTGETSLSPEETKDGWTLLWDGATTAGWRSAQAPLFPASGWVIRDGVLSALGSGGHAPGQGGDIITVGEYSDFELSADFKVTPGANSGIKIFVAQEANRGPGGASIGLEYQILDAQLNPDAWTLDQALLDRPGIAEAVAAAAHHRADAAEQQRCANHAGRCRSRGPEKRAAAAHRRHTTGAHDVERSKDIGVLHTNSRRAVAAHGVAHQTSARALWNCPVMRIYIGDNIARDEILEIARGDRA